MLHVNFNTYNNYVTDSLYQWDKDQDLIINGLGLSVAPEVHFANANMDKAIVKQSNLSSNVVTVRIPNSLLQEALTIKAYVGVYDDTTFNVIETIEIPVIPKAKPADYTLEVSDEEVYSFKALDNRISNIIANTGSTQGNSELVDIRVDYKGNTHTTAGDAVRAQFSDLNENKFDKSSVVQTTGASTDKVMSQKLLTDILNDICTDVNGFVHSSPGDAIRNQVTNSNNDLTDIRGGGVDFDSIELFKLKDCDKTTIIHEYDVNIASTRWGTSVISAYIVPKSPITSIEVDCYIESDNIAEIKFSVEDKDGKRYTNIDNKIHINETITFESAISSTLAINLSVTGSKYPLHYRIKRLIITYDNTKYDGVNFIINSSFCSGTISNIFTEYSGFETKNSKFKEKKWIAVGDSLTDFSTLGSNVKNYVNYVSDKTGIEYINKGVSGTGYWKGHTSNSAFYQRVSEFTEDNVDVITIFGSFNDLGSESNIIGSTILGTYTDTTTDTVCGCMNKTIDALIEKYPNALLGIIAPTPWSNSRDYDIGKTYTDKLKQIAEYRNIPYLDLFHKSNLRPWDESFRALYYKTKYDGAHPNTDGHKRIASNVIKFLEEIIY